MTDDLWLKCLSNLFQQVFAINPEILFPGGE
jgi:hypothetical protein